MTSDTHSSISPAAKLSRILLMCALLAGCASSGGATSDLLGNDKGSAPINENESNEYKKAIVRCYKTGGTRVVKIMGTLKCY